MARGRSGRIRARWATAAARNACADASSTALAAMGGCSTTTGWPSATIWNQGCGPAAATAALVRLAVAQQRRGILAGLAQRVDAGQVGHGRREEAAGAQAQRGDPARGGRAHDALRRGAARERALGAADHAHRRCRWHASGSTVSRPARPRCAAPSLVADHRAQAPERRRGQAQDGVVGQRREVAVVQARSDRHAELELAHPLVGAADLGGLLPCGGHQRLLVHLHDARAERRHRAPARIEVEHVEPGRRAGAFTVARAAYHWP